VVHDIVNSVNEKFTIVNFVNKKFTPARGSFTWYIFPG